MGLKSVPSWDTVRPSTQMAGALTPEPVPSKANNLLISDYYRRDSTSLSLSGSSLARFAPEIFSELNNPTLSDS